MSLAFDIVTIVAVSAGALFFLAGTIGLLRFPDTLTRLHALTKADNLGLGLVGLAVWVVTARETFAAAESFVAYGLLLPLVWVRLGSVDVALAEAAIGGGLGGVLLLGAAARLRTTEVAVARERPGGTLRLGAAMLAAIVACSLAVVLLALPDPAPTLAPLAVKNGAATGL